LVEVQGIRLNDLDTWKSSAQELDEAGIFLEHDQVLSIDAGIQYCLRYRAGTATELDHPSPGTNACHQQLADCRTARKHGAHTPRVTQPAPEEPTVLIPGRESLALFFVGLGQTVTVD
jgi:hypothetical protein